MSGAPRAAASSGREEAEPSLDALSMALRDARTHVQQLRQQGAPPQPLAEARRRLLVALEAYVGALERRRFPVPPTLHGELELHRKLFF